MLNSPINSALRIDLYPYLPKVFCVITMFVCSFVSFIALSVHEFTVHQNVVDLMHNTVC